MKRAATTIAAAALVLSHAAVAAGADAGSRIPVAPTPGEGYFLVDSTAASVEGDIIFRSDVERELCLVRCGAFPGEQGEKSSFGDARRRLVEDTAILHEQRRLSLGSVDNALLTEAVAGVRERIGACKDPCAAGLGTDVPMELARRRLLVRDFLERRVSAFVEVTDEEVERERIILAGRTGVALDSVDPDKVRETLSAGKREREMARWREAAAAKARVVMPRSEEEQ